MDLKEHYRIVGTSHVSYESVERVKHAFNEFRPNIICVELDKNRFYALKNKDSSRLPISAIRKIGVTGFLFALIGRFVQKKIGNLVGMNPGEEMLVGARLAEKNNLKLALIDQDASITLRNLSKKVSFREKARIVKDILLAPFSRREKVMIDLARIPPDEFIKKILLDMKSRYPGLYKALLDDRNKYMAKRIFLLLRDNPGEKILVIVGAGHVEGLDKDLSSIINSNLSVFPEH